MPTEQSQDSLSPRKVKDTCVAHLCPTCGTDHHVSVELVLRGDTTVRWCHCGACGYSWHPVVQEARDPQAS